MVGDTLLGNERKRTTLSHQRRCLVNGTAPLPLYTCLNVKKNVSARVFQDWIEFSPYEVGVPKYGAFMKPENFASKFYVGKLLKQFPECPLHFLQGVWGSAFCILFKRLISQGGTSAANKNKDLAEIIRDSNEEQYKQEEASTREEIQTLATVGDLVGDDDLDYESTYSSEEEFEFHSSDESSCGSSTSSRRVAIRKHVDVTTRTEITETSPTKTAARGKLERRRAIKRDVSEQSTPRGKSAWNEKRKSTKRIKEEETKTFWERTMESVLSTSLLDTRAGRAGLIFNPLRGLNLKMTFPVSPFLSPVTPTTADDDIDFKGFYEPTELRAKKLYLVDSGLTFNLPFPLLLRPQRAVDLYLSFDFSGRATDESSPFKEILLAEQWARLNHMPFPPVARQVAQFEKEPVRELYVFKDEKDEYCPVILHFVILNKTFRHFKAPGVPRETDEEKEFADFEIFGEKTPYTIYNFCYTNQQFDRLSQLMEFNVRLKVEEIKHHIAEAVSRKQRLMPKPPVAVEEIPMLRNKVRNNTIIDRFTRFVKSMSIVQGSDDEFYDARSSLTSRQETCS
ncbi:hypothetical protein B566_EDAN015746 [Ephemera danica]|nr:hypothetical protein B566_EDAN015746 [Ephemera danica]